jgi:LysM repeat protein
VYISAPGIHQDHIDRKKSMAGKDSPQSVIDSYRKRQQMMPYLIGGLAILLVAVGIIILVVWFTGGSRSGGGIALFASRTPTSTSTNTPTPVTPTLTPSITPTVSATPTITETTTPTGPYEYTVKEEDNCWDIAANQKVDLDVLLAINNFGDSCPIKPGDKILIPAPNQTLPTETAVPADLASGTKLEYRVKLNETLAQIASRFNSSVDEILRLTNDYNKKNGLTTISDQNAIQYKQLLIIPVNIVTATPTKVPTSTSMPKTTQSVITQTPAAATVAAATVPPTATKQP